LKLLASPADEVSLRRIINLPARGIGTKVVGALIDDAVSRGEPTISALARARGLPGVSPAAAEAIERFRRMIDLYRGRLANEPLVTVVSDLIAEIGYHDEIRRQYKEPLDQQTRWASVEEVVNALGAYEKRAKRVSLQGFLDDVTLGDRDNENDKEAQLERNAVALMTLHSAKGLEFPQVYLVGMEEGLLPHRRAVEMDGAAIDEERRLCYVGITRAQDRLTISLALGRMKWGKLRETQPSRFLFEITGQAEGAKNGANRKPKRSPGKSPAPASPAKPSVRAQKPAKGSTSHRRAPRR
jgi:DNA helicase II / ATP-dependent DNA helicase PcrA